MIAPSDFVFVIQAADTTYPASDLGTTGVPSGTGARGRGTLRGPGSAGESPLARLHAEPGPLEIRYDAIIDVVHHFALPSDVAEVPVAELPASVLQFVLPSRYCQSDRLVDVAHGEFGSWRPATRGSTRSGSGCAIARGFRPDRAIRARRRSTRSRSAACAATSHLMIAICRAINVPSRLATGIDYDADPALGPVDFHCVRGGVAGRSLVPVRPVGHFAAHGPRSPRHGVRRGRRGAVRHDLRQVQWTPPRIEISAEGDEINGLTRPFRHDYAVSTDCALAEADEVVGQLRALPLDSRTPYSRSRL